MNIDRIERGSDWLPLSGAKLENELQNIVETVNDHNQGRKGWDRLDVITGSDKRCGTATLVGGTVTVSNTSVTASTLVMISRQASGGTLGHLSVSRSDGTSFTVTSSSATDTSTVAWLLIEPK